MNAVTGTLFTSHVMKQATNQEQEQEEESKEDVDGEQVTFISIHVSTNILGLK